MDISILQRVYDMKKILIISFYYPPNNSIGGKRMYYLIKNLKNDQNYKLTLITSEPNVNDSSIEVKCLKFFDIFNENIKKNIKNTKGKIRSDKNKSVKKFLNKIQFLIFFPEHYLLLWYIPNIIKINKIRKNNNFDYIISSSPPNVVHFIGKFFKNRNNIWIADFRDPWEKRYSNKHSLMNFIDGKIKLKTILKANIITCISDYYLNGLKNKNNNTKYYKIMNSYDSNEYKCKVKLLEKFTITYTGSLYGGKRNPEILFKAIRSLLDKKIMEINNIQIRFYGNDSYTILDKIQYYKLSDIVELHRNIDHKDIINKQKESHLLLLLLVDQEDEYGVFTGKFFEYIGAKRPILSIGPKSEIQKFIINKKIGIHTNNQKNLEKYLLFQYNNYINNAEIYYNNKFDNEKYSDKKMSENFKKLLK